MKDILLDVVDHTAGLGFIENVKVTGTDAETAFEAMDADRTVILNAKTTNPVAEFVGKFGMGNLGFLNGIVNLNGYKAEEGKIVIFSSTLKHYVPKNRCDNRLVLAGNMRPVGHKDG